MVKTSTIVAMHPPCNVRIVHKDSWTYKSHLMPFSSRALLFSSFDDDDDDDFLQGCVKFEQCKGYLIERGVLRVRDDRKTSSLERNLKFFDMSMSLRVFLVCVYLF